MEFQSEFLRRLNHRSPPMPHCTPKLLQQVMECDEDTLNLSLGGIGNKLKLFAQNLDFEHPEISSIFDGLIADDQEFAKECLELLALAKFAKEKNLCRVIPSLGNFLSRNIANKNILKKIDIPVNSKIHVRLLKNPISRKEIRLTKRMQIIHLQSICNKDQDVWDAQPDNFNKFLRFDSAYEEDVVAATKKANRYRELGCISLADEIQKSIDIFRDHMQHSYYGFNRITMTNAAIILAKSLKYKFKQTEDSQIIVERKFFGKYNFDPDQPTEFSPYISQMAGFPIFSLKTQLPFKYEPRIYPLHELSELISEEVQSTIDLLENFPEADNKPIFDHFGVIVPGVAFPLPSEDFHTFVNKQGVAQTYSSREDALKALDKILINSGFFTPILIAEKNGKCYFICYFK